MPTREQMIADIRKASSSSLTKEQMIADIRAAQSKQQTMQSGFLDIANERNKDISGWDRFKLKNLGGSLEDQKAYLQQKYPNLDVQIDNNEIIAKRPDEQTYTKLDPSSFELADISDIAYDIGSGLTSGAATTLGLGFGGPVGAVGAGAASSAGMEYLRQKLGQAAGVHGKTSAGDIALSGALGGAAPVLFGAGTAAKQGMKGLVPMGIDYVKNKTIPAVKEGLLSTASILSGIKKPIIKTAIAQEQTIKELSDPAKLVKFADDAYDSVWNPAKEAVDKFGEEHRSSLVGMGKNIDIGTERKVIFDELKARVADIKPNPLQRGAGELDEIKSEIRNISNIIPRAKEIDPKSVVSLLQRLRERTKPWTSTVGKGPSDNEVTLLKRLEASILKQMPDDVRLKALTYGEAKDALTEVSKKYGIVGKEKDAALLRGLMSDNTIDKAPLNASISFLEGLANNNNLTKASETIKALKDFGAYETATGKSRTLFKTPAAYVGGGIGGATGRRLSLGGGEGGGGAGALLGTSIGALTGWMLSSPSALLKYAHGSKYLGKALTTSEKNTAKLLYNIKKKFPNASPQVLMNLMNNPQNSGSAYDNLGE